jgi:hypothetical protein
MQLSPLHIAPVLRHHRHHLALRHARHAGESERGHVHAVQPARGHQRSGDAADAQAAHAVLGGGGHRHRGEQHVQGVVVGLYKLIDSS